MISYVMAEKKIHDERFKIARRRGNGMLRREVWVDELGQVVRYNLAFINFALFTGDNGRVLGYDNHHGQHHRHCYGTPGPFTFTSFEDLEERFQSEWVEFLAKDRRTN